MAPDLYGPEDVIAAQLESSLSKRIDEVDEAAGKYIGILASRIEDLEKRIEILEAKSNENQS